MQTASPLFKGATRPACVAGVPMKPFILNVGFFILLGAYVWIPLMLIFPVTHYWLMKVAEKDDQIFGQYWLYLQLNIRGHLNRGFWNGVTSYAPKQGKKELFILDNQTE